VPASVYGRRLRCLPPGEVASRTFGVTQRGGTFRHMATGHDLLRYVTTLQGISRPH
jgi:hypothetical protein